MEWLVVLEDILCLFIGSSAPHCDLASRSLFDQLLSPASRADDLADVVCLLIVDCVISQINLFEFLQRLVITRRNEPRVYRNIRFTHLHAVFNERDPLPEEVVALANFASVDTLALVVVDGFRTGGAQIGVFRHKIVHLRVEFVKPVKS